MRERMENHCALVNFPLVSSRAGRRMDPWSLSLSIPRWIRGRKRARRERETCSHTLYLQIHVAGKHTQARGGGRHVAVAGRRENSTGRFICMLVFFRSLERSLLSDSRPTTRYYDNRGGIFFVHPRPPPLQTATTSRPSVERERRGTASCPAPSILF